MVVTLQAYTLGKSLIRYRNLSWWNVSLQGAVILLLQRTRVYLPFKSDLPEHDLIDILSSYLPFPHNLIGETFEPTFVYYPAQSDGVGE